MKLVVGLGNPGPQYQRTRHNAGFLVNDELARRWGAAWRDKFKGRFAKISFGGADAVLLEPHTYMNRSGQSVQAAASFFQVNPEDVVVVHDELDLPLGTVRVKFKGGHGGHNGLRSIAELLGADTIRVRCGIGRPQKGNPTSWVLGPFADDEITWVDDMIDRAADAVEAVVRDGVASAMNQFNG